MVGLNSAGRMLRWLLQRRALGVLGQLLRGGGKGLGLIRPSVAPTSFHDPISGQGWLSPGWQLATPSRSSGFCRPQPAQMLFSIRGGGWTVGAQPISDSHVHAAIHPFAELELRDLNPSDE